MGKNRTILLVDDEEKIVEVLQAYLEKAGYEVLCAYDGAAAMELFRNNDISLILLDLMLPDIMGEEICRMVRAVSRVPIIMLTAKDSEIDKVLGLELGADDYVTKPFSNRELVARVKANLRRTSSANAAGSEEDEANRELEVGDLTIHPDAYTVSKRGENIELTHREFELLHYLARHLGQVMTREHLLQTVWGYDYFGDVRTVDVTVRRLREKIEDNPSHPEWLVTRRGVGYYLRNPDAE